MELKLKVTFTPFEDEPMMLTVLSTDDFVDDENNSARTHPISFYIQPESANGEEWETCFDLTPDQAATLHEFLGKALASRLWAVPAEHGKQ